MKEWASLLKSVDEDIIGDVDFVQGKWEAMGNAIVVKQGKNLISLIERDRKLMEEILALPNGSDTRDTRQKAVDIRLLEKELDEGVDFDRSYRKPLEPELLD